MAEKLVILLNKL